MQGMPSVPPQYSELDHGGHQQAHMASLARSLFEPPEIKRANGIQPSGPLPISQQELPSSKAHPLSF